MTASEQAYYNCGDLTPADAAAGNTTPSCLSGPGTGTPEPGGLTTRELQLILRGLDGLRLAGADVVEVAPAYDHAALTSLAAANVVYELLGLFAGQLGWRGAFWDWLGGLDLNTVGFAVVGMFVLTWVVALLVWRYGRIEEKWTPATKVN